MYELRAESFVQVADASAYRTWIDSVAYNRYATTVETLEMGYTAILTFVGVKAELEK